MSNAPGPERRQGHTQDASFDHFVEQTMKEFHAPGLAVATVYGDQIWTTGYGFSDLAKEIPVTPETLFFAGSTTKSFTSALAAHLVESTQHPNIKWDTPLAELIRDDWVLDQSSPSGQWATNHITVEDALCHRTGLPRHDLVWINGQLTNREIVRQLRHLPVHRELRAGFEYCNNTYTAVSYAMEQVCQKPFDLLLQEHVFQPLGMENTLYCIPDDKGIADARPELELARGYLWDDGAQKYRAVDLSDLPHPRGAGGIVSNVVDYSKWVMHLMHPPSSTSGPTENTVKELRTPRILVDPHPKMPFVGPQAYCLGLYSQVYRGREIISHSGAIGGYMASMLMVSPTPAEIENGAADSGWAIVTMQNSYSLAQDVVTWKLLDDYLDTPEKERFNKAQTTRDAQAKKEDSMHWDNVVKRLFAMESSFSCVDPSLPLKSYEGAYRHPAYHDFNVTLASDNPPEDHSGESANMLYLIPAGKRCLDLNVTLHHVSGEWWWAYSCMGPKSWITDEALKVQFVVGATGEVEGMRYQAEPAMLEYLAFFEKVK